MRTHADEIYDTVGKKREDLSNTLGLCMAIDKPRYSDDGKYLFAVLFLNEDNLGSGIVAHECLHIAMAHERFVLRFGMNYGNGLDDLEDEERLAYFVTHCAKAVYNVLYDNKHIAGKIETE